MSVVNALKRRISARGFLPRPVPRDTLEEIFSRALQAPSNCNVQPWNIYVVSGPARDRLSRELLAEVTSGRESNPDFSWQMGYQDEHRERQFGAAAALYDAMGIDRKDREARQQAMLRNWEFFGAPHAVFFVMEKYLGMMGAVDMGILAQTLALLMAEQGIDSCMQGALNQFPGPARAMFDLPDSQGVLFGMSFGYIDEEQPANRARTVREPLGKLVTFVDQ
jgi:nitroreductase